MDMQDNGVESPSPRKLLAAFSGGRMFFWILTALLIHVVVIGGLSVGYIRDRWIDPDGAAVRKAAAAAAVQALKQQAEAKNRPPAKSAATNAVPVAASTNTVTTAAPVANAGVTIPPDRENSPVVRRITEKTPTNELPRLPGELGISIEDTNRRP